MRDGKDVSPLRESWTFLTVLFTMSKHFLKNTFQFRQKLSLTQLSRFKLSPFRELNRLDYLNNYNALRSYLSKITKHSK